MKTGEWGERFEWWGETDWKKVPLGFWGGQWMLCFEAILMRKGKTRQEQNVNRERTSTRNNGNDSWVKRRQRPFYTIFLRGLGRNSIIWNQTEIVYTIKNTGKKEEGKKNLKYISTLSMNRKRSNGDAKRECKAHIRNKRTRSGHHLRDIGIVGDTLEPLLAPHGGVGP